jgi:hypothetical protein
MGWQFRSATEARAFYQAQAKFSTTAASTGDAFASMLSNP